MQSEAWANGRAERPGKTIIDPKERADRVRSSDLLASLELPVGKCGQLTIMKFLIRRL